MAYQFTASEEFLVNTLTDEGQFYGDIAALKTGGFVAVWVLQEMILVLLSYVARQRRLPPYCP